MNKVGVAALALLASVGLSGFTYDNSEGVYGPPGSHLTLGSEKVDPAKVGKVCEVSVDLGNNDSTRPGSDIVVESGDSLAAFPNTEAVTGDPGPVVVNMQLGETVTATLTFGPNKEYDGHGYDNAAFSGFGTVTVGECETPVPPVMPPTPSAPLVVATPRTTG
jgi:hypothetical protein